MRAGRKTSLEIPFKFLQACTNALTGNAASHQNFKLGYYAQSPPMAGQWLCRRQWPANGCACGKQTWVVPNPMHAVTPGGPAKL